MLHNFNLPTYKTHFGPLLVLILFFTCKLDICVQAASKVKGEPDLKRLPLDVLPTFYDLHLIIDLKTDSDGGVILRTNGSVNISVIVRKETDHFYLSVGKGLKIHTVHIELDDQQITSGKQGGINFYNFSL